MAYATSKLFLLSTLLALAAILSAARPRLVPSVPTLQGSNNSKALDLAARLKNLEAAEGESSNCWDSLVELQACTGEVIMFFLNGETYLGPTCCRAIRVIGQHCWPTMFGSIGFTNEEADILQGFCEGLEEHSFSPPPPPSLPPSTDHDQAVFVGN